MTALLMLPSGFWVNLVAVIGECWRNPKRLVGLTDSLVCKKFHCKAQSFPSFIYLLIWHFQTRTEKIFLFSFFQLKYNNAETKGPCLSIFYPENTNPVSLPVTAVSVEALISVEEVAVYNFITYFNLFKLE